MKFGKWQLIESAPKDGQSILVWDADNKWQYEAWWGGVEGWENPDRLVNPTHWTFLLPPPTGGK